MLRPRSRSSTATSTTIGRSAVDRNGVDWQTVGTWARLRAENGHPEPVRIDLWEIGNEVYGGRPEAGGDECASFGWEDVWTCDGAEYVDGDAEHDGYRDIRAAMIEVDPSIGVGAVGVGDPSSWSNWGNEVIEGAAGEFDFYVVHHYGFDESPDPEAALRRPAEIWPDLADGLGQALPADIPVAITEYNLVSFASGDIDRTMTRAANALYIAETVGQMATQGVAIANQWNLANGTAEGGTDYGMIDLRDGSVFPQYHALRLWSLAGDALLDHDGLDPAGDLRVYPTRRADGSLAVVTINLGADEVLLDLELGRRGREVGHVDDRADRRPGRRRHDRGGCPTGERRRERPHLARRAALVDERARGGDRCLTPPTNPAPRRPVCC